MAPEVVPAVSKAYGPDRPRYADDLTGGIGFQAGRQEPAVRVFIGQRAAPAGDGVIVASASSPRPSLWSRLFRRGRSR